MIKRPAITSLEDLIRNVRVAHAKWGKDVPVWFRGEPGGTSTPLLPKLYRPRKRGRPYNENHLLQQFRIKAPTLGLLNTPPRNNTDEWLFLAQHMGLPTRLLDWSEGLLIATYFALLEKKGTIWMLNPLELNKKSTLTGDIDEFPLTWFSADRSPATKLDLKDLRKQLVYDITFKRTKAADFAENRNAGNMNIRGAWEHDNREIQTPYPVAIYPTYSHPRMISQKSCFTIHGAIKQSLSDMVDGSVVRRFDISQKYASKMREDLWLCGITRTSVFPELESLAVDIARLDWGSQ